MLPDDVQNDILITLVRVMPMRIPVGRAHMQLYGTHPQQVVNSNFGLLEICPRIPIFYPGMDDVQLIPVGQGQ